MSRMTFKSTFLIVLVLLILFFLCIYGVKRREKEETTQIFDIKNTQMIYSPPDSKIVTIEKHYIIINPPKDLHELKTVVEKYQEDNPIDKEIVLDGNKTRVFELYFYRKSKKLPRNWQPNEGYFTTDRIEHHKDDCIATIIWSDSNGQKSFYVMRKSSNKDDYGSAIEEIEYIDNEIVEN